MNRPRKMRLGSREQSYRLLNSQHGGREAAESDEEIAEAGVGEDVAYGRRGTLRTLRNEADELKCGKCKSVAFVVPPFLSVRGIQTPLQTLLSLYPLRRPTAPLLRRSLLQTIPLATQLFGTNFPIAIDTSLSSLHRLDVLAVAHQRAQTVCRAATGSGRWPLSGPSRVHVPADPERTAPIRSNLP